LDFGVFRTDVKAKSQYVLPGGVVMLALSHDVIAHEVAHALLDGMRAHFQLNTHYDVPAFHEAFADIVALFHHFQYRDMVAQSIEEHGTVDSNMLLQLAREFGEALHGSEGSSLRHAIRPGGTEVDELSYKSDSAKQPHKRGSILVAAVFSAYLSVYQKRSNSLIRLANLTHREGGAQRWMPSDLVKLLADEACRLASDFLHVCIQAIDYCPPLDVRFGDYLRAIVTADRMLDPEDEDGIRDALIKEFRRREIDFGRVRDLSEFSLEWNSPFPEKRPQVPDLAWSRLRFQNDGITPLRTEEVERQASALGEFVLGQVRDYRLAREFGVSPVGGEFGPVTVESIRPVVKRGRQGAIKHGLVAELAQPRDAASGRFWGGSTIIVDAEGRIQFSIRKSADDERMIQQADYRQSTGAPQTLSFRDLHSTTTEKE
jgi:hypothetical protein